MKREPLITLGRETLEGSFGVRNGEGKLEPGIGWRGAVLLIRSGRAVALPGVKAPPSGGLVENPSGVLPGADISRPD